MSNNKKILVFLAVLILITAFAWVIPANMQIPLKELLLTPSGLGLLFLGFASPTIAGICLGKDSQKKWIFSQNFTDLPRPKYVVLLPLMLLLHFGLHGIGGYGYQARVRDLAPYMASLFIAGAVQEIGWVKILRPMMEKRNGFWKSMFSTGLFRALWLVPLMYIPGFSLMPTAYIYFAAAITGVSIMSTTLYMTSGSIILSMVFHGLLLMLTPLLQAKQTWLLILYALVEIAFCSAIIKYRGEEIKREAQRERFRRI